LPRLAATVSPRTTTMKPSEVTIPMCGSGIGPSASRPEPCIASISSLTPMKARITDSPTLRKIRRSSSPPIRK